MARPIIGILTNSHLINDQYEVYGSGAINVEAVSDVCDALPLLIPSAPDHVMIEDLMDRCAGFIFTGARPNVHPDEYGEEETPAYGDFDRGRDGVALPLIRACVERGLPIFGICRGFQEVNVAMGGSLYPEIRDLPGRTNHRMPPDGTMEEKFELRHEVKFQEGGVFHRVLGSNAVMTNTLHGQGIKEPGERIVIDGVAPDGTPEAIYVKDAAGFTLSVQWHPEWKAAQSPVSKALFTAFGDAVNAWDAGELRPAVKLAG
jgi:putative glutamine amidotransferase